MPSPRSLLFRLLPSNNTHGLLLLSRSLTASASAAAAAGGGGQSCKVFVGGLSGQVDEELLKDAFASFGQVIDGMCGIFPMDYNVWFLVIARW